MKAKNRKSALSRRTALKLAGLSGTALLFAAPRSAEAKTADPGKKLSPKTPLRIVIIGGGMAGTTLAYRLRRAISWPEITLFEPLRSSAWYQPGLTRLGIGTCCEKDLEYRRSDFIPEGVKWVESAVTAIDPEKREITDAGGGVTVYDFLIIASGAKLDYGAIEGLEGEISSLQMLEEKAAWMDDPSIASIYYYHGAAQLHEQFNTLVQKAVESKEKLTVLFTQESITIKSPGAAKSALFALAGKLESAGVRKRVELIVASGDGRLSASAQYDKKYKEMLEKWGIDFRKARLEKLELETRTALFEGGEKIHYDLLHVAPPMAADKLFGTSGLSDENGWIDVDAETLQHKRYAEIFAAGDVAALSTMKTGAAVVDQVKVIVEAIRAIDEGKKPDVNYGGYGCDTVLFPAEQSALFEAWEKGKKPLSVLSFIDPLKRHRLYWYLDARLIKPYVMWGVMHGWA